ncbi:hypothetical protein M2R47_05310 [Moraxella sp. Tifton1]|uniref:hypothetical protein n=1 Tax=Moraxella oculi TaxID=2940516 RepID=UPI0020125B27|nr:hypothetical protein [Moraxella sp. Tifton1]MCL1623657.1 hypothetical protein [Moraxella sp. Tifton1]
MNIISVKEYLSEIISLDKINEMLQNSVLSQNLLAVTPNGLNWLFYCSNSDDLAIPPYNHTAQSVRFPFMVWLILQNKPIGEYVKRLLTEPRVRPHHPNLGFLLNKLLGAF